MCGPTWVQGLIAARSDWQHATGPGGASLGVLELTALPTIGAERWVRQRWAADLGLPAYAIDEQTAIAVVDGTVEVVSEGQWTRLEQSPAVRAAHRSRLASIPGTHETDVTGQIGLSPTVAGMRRP